MTWKTPEFQRNKYDLLCHLPTSITKNTGLSGPFGTCREMLESQIFPASKEVPRQASCGEAQGRLLFLYSCALCAWGQASEHAPGDAACQAHTRKSKRLTNLATEDIVNTFRLRQFITYKDGERKTSQTSQLPCPHTPTRITLKPKEPDASLPTWTGCCWGASCRQQRRGFSLQLYSEGLRQKLQGDETLS